MIITDTLVAADCRISTFSKLSMPTGSKLNPFRNDTNKRVMEQNSKLPKALVATNTI